ncbi:hypothetical protein ACLMNJ_27290 [Streptomyces seoulensis]
MRLRRRRKSWLAPGLRADERIVLRNIDRIMNRRRRTLWQWCMSGVSAAEGLWARHVAHRELHRQLDVLRDAFQRALEEPRGTDDDDGLERLRRDVVADVNSKLDVQPGRETD